MKPLWRHVSCHAWKQRRPPFPAARVLREGVQLEHVLPEQIGEQRGAQPALILRPADGVQQRGHLARLAAVEDARGAQQRRGDAERAQRLLHFGRLGIACR